MAGMFYAFKCWFAGNMWHSPVPFEDSYYERLILREHIKRASVCMEGITAPLRVAHGQHSIR